MDRSEYLTSGGFHLGFWDHPDHQVEIEKAACDPGSLSVIEFGGIPDGITNYGRALTIFYETYCYFAGGGSMFCERKIGMAGRIGFGGNISEERTYKRLHEESSVLTAELKKRIGAQMYAESRKSSGIVPDRDGHIAAFQSAYAARKEADLNKAEEAQWRREKNLEEAARKEERQSVAALKRATQKKDGEIRATEKREKALNVWRKKLLATKRKEAKARDKKTCINLLRTAGVEIQENMGNTQFFREKLAKHLYERACVQEGVE
eukprot:gene31597-39782_t